MFSSSGNFWMTSSISKLIARINNLHATQNTPKLLCNAVKDFWANKQYPFASYPSMGASVKALNCTFKGPVKGFAPHLFPRRFVQWVTCNVAGIDNQDATQDVARSLYSLFHHTTSNLNVIIRRRTSNENQVCQRDEAWSNDLFRNISYRKQMFCSSFILSFSVLISVITTPSQCLIRSSMNKTRPPR